MNHLSDGDIIKIKTTWRIPMEDPSESGQAILLKFFERYPSNLEKFKNFKGLSIEELKVNTHFHAHASKIIRIFDEAINTLGTDYTDSALQEIWSKIAISHHKRDISKASYNELKEIILETLVAVCDMNNDQKGAWEKLFICVYNIIFQTIDNLTK
ncbi:CYGB family protein [Megaselia abdita]